MEEKIKNCLQDIANVHRIFIDEQAESGIIYLREPCITSTVLQLLNYIVDIVAISAIMSDEYIITFRFH